MILSTLIGHSQETELSTYSLGEGINLKFNDGSKIRFTSYLQPFMETRGYTKAELNNPNRFRMRRARLRINGSNANEKFSYRFQFDLSGNGEVEEQDGQFLLDALVNYHPSKNVTLSFGQRSLYTDNRELLMLSNTLQFVERSRVTSAFAAIRDFGFFASANYKIGNSSFIRPQLEITTGDGGNVFTKNRGGFKYGGRLDYLPFGLFTNFGQFRQSDMVRERTPKLAFGVNYSFNEGMSDRRGRQSGTIIYLNDNDEETLPNFAKIGVDFLFKYNGFSAIGEFVKTNAYVPETISKRVRDNGTVTSNFLVNDVQDIENYVKGRIILGEAYNIQMGYLFKNGFSVDGQYTHLKADKHSFLNNPTFYNRPNYYTLGISKYLSRNYGAKIQTSFTYIESAGTINDINGNAIQGNEWIGRIMLTFAL